MSWVISFFVKAIYVIFCWYVVQAKSPLAEEKGVTCKAAARPTQNGSEQHRKRSPSDGVGFPTIQLLVLRSICANA